VFAKRNLGIPRALTESGFQGTGSEREWGFLALMVFWPTRVKNSNIETIFSSGPHPLDSLTDFLRGEQVVTGSGSSLVDA